MNVEGLVCPAGEDGVWEWVCAQQHDVSVRQEEGQVSKRVRLSMEHAARDA